MIPPIARRFVAGETPAEALEYVRTINEAGVGAMVNRLGSHTRERSKAEATAAEYRSFVRDVDEANLTASVALKPTQIGLELGEEAFRELLSGIVSVAAERDVFVWVDMEEHATTDATLDAFEEVARAAGGGVGVCLQANLKRTPADLDRLADVPGAVRLVKGTAYDPPPRVAHTDGERIDRVYRSLLRDAFERFDGTVAVASHDPEMIDHAISLHERYGTDFEIQMLMGVRPEAQIRRAREYDVSQYVPYGPRWKRWALNRARNGVRFAAKDALDGAVGIHG
ncbi:MAG: proline dehydrogenase family protein [Salinigranum sp.]